MAAAVAEGVLKAAALVDLAWRPEARVRGPKLAWAAAILVVNSLGAVPLAYFVVGRQPRQLPAAE